MAIRPYRFSLLVQYLSASPLVLQGGDWAIPDRAEVAENWSDLSDSIA